MEVSKEDLIRLAADTNRQVASHSLAVWYLLAHKGIITSEDGDLINRSYAQASHDVDQSQEKHIQEAMETMTPGAQDLLKRSLGM